MIAPIDVSEYEIELAKCVQSPRYFIEHYCYIYDGKSENWILFELWESQADVLDKVHTNQKLIGLKARQLGLTWLMLAYALWLMLFRPIASVLLFSKRDDEAVYLLGNERLRGMYKRLPDWMKADAVSRDDAHVFGLSNGSVARAFPTTAGDSYTATFALVDEADLVPNLDSLLLSVRPTVDMGGKLVLISKSDKSNPQSRFKKIYRAVTLGGSDGWVSVFLPWHVHPARDAAWYEREKVNTLDQTGSLDDLHENYPATDKEALAPSTADKRIPFEWLNRCYVESKPISDPYNAPAILDLTVYEMPERNIKYAAGVDCAEGLVSSDDSVTQIIRTDTGKQVAKISGKITPEQHAMDTAKLCRWYNDAPCLVERNNHGHAFIVVWGGSNGTALLSGMDKKRGWQTNTLSKSILYNDATDIVKDGGTVIVDSRTHDQLTLIERETLSAPPGEMDDEAVAYVLALNAAKRGFITQPDEHPKFNAREW